MGDFFLKNSFCFTKSEFYNYVRNIYRELAKDWLLKNSLLDIEKLKRFLSKQNLKKKEDVELWISSFIVLEFFKGSKVCFPLKDSIRDKSKISFNVLSKYLKENSIVDFIILTNEDKHKFQLKQYKGNPNTRDFLDFLKKIFNKYGYNFGDTNLFIIPQPNTTTPQNFRIDLEKVHKNIKDINFRGRFSVYVSFNRNDMDALLVEIYPSFKKESIPMSKIKPSNFSYSS